MKSLLRGLAVIGLLGLSSCAMEAQVAPTLAGAAAVMPGRVSQVPTLLVLSDLGSANRQITPTEKDCAMVTYTLGLADPLRSSIRRTVLAAFPNLRIGSDGEHARAGEARIAISVESVEARMRLTPGFLQASATSTVEVALNVHVTDSRGRDTFRGIALGTGTQDATGRGCELGATVLGEAAGNALRHVLQDFVSKAINSTPVN